MNSISKIPSHYDMAFLIEASGVTNHYGFEAREGEIHFRYQFDDIDAVQTAIDTYPVAYRAVMVPKMLAEVAAMRAERALAFSFANMPITLNDKTVANLTAAKVGLDGNPDVLSIDWAVNNSTSVELPRDVVIAMANAAFRHVQRCFTAQKVIAAEIKAAGDIDVLRAMDIANHEAWPA